MVSSLRKKLSELKPGEKGVVVEVGGDRMLRRRLMDMGLVKGRKIKVIRNAPLGDPVEFEALGYPLSLRKNEAKYVIVEVR